MRLAPLLLRPFLYGVVDTEFLGGRSIRAVVTALARGGAALLQVRTKRGGDAERVTQAREALSAARALGTPLLVNDRPDIARIVSADGVHLGQDDLPVSAARKLLGPEAIIGISTHNRAQASAATSEPVDYVAFGPIFPTRTKANADAVVGLDGLRSIRPLVGGTLIAIGGINRTNAAEVVAAGADGVAAISELLGEPDLEAAARSFREALCPTPH